jgi:hypothetical protein
MIAPLLLSIALVTVSSKKGQRALGVRVRNPDSILNEVALLVDEIASPLGSFPYYNRVFLLKLVHQQSDSG